MINIRKLAVVDVVWLGTRVILSTWQADVGIWLVSIAANYIPLFI